MSSVAYESVIMSRSQDWLTLRIRGLLQNEMLASCLKSAGTEFLKVRLETGSIRVKLTEERDESFWTAWVAIAVNSHLNGAPLVSPVLADSKHNKASRRQVRFKPSSAVMSAREIDGDHSIPIEKLLSEPTASGPMDVHIGLSTIEARARLAQNGPNEIRDVTCRSSPEILLSQFKSVPVALLAGSAAIALITRSFADAGAICSVLAANATLGFVTERRAEETVSSLRKLEPRQTTVLRDGVAVTIEAREVVVGDVLILKPGESVAADARVVEAHRLATNEAALTGESLPVHKEPIDALPMDTPLCQRQNMVFMGTVVSGGTGLAVVIATAERAALGRIRLLAQGAEAPTTQLQQELDVLGKRLAVGAVSLCVGVFALGAIRGRPLLPLLRTVVSLGVAAIPEGLPTVATSLLAASVRSLQKRQVFARRLDAIENLGAVDTVCFDKTGTLTQNRMKVASLTIGDELVLIEENKSPLTLPEAWLKVAVLCNCVERINGDPDRQWQGSSTEIALVEFAVSLGADAVLLRRKHATMEVRHRSEHHPYMVTLHKSNVSGVFVAVKGRPDEVLSRCSTWHDGQRSRRLQPAQRRRLLKLNETISGRGDRVLALACREEPAHNFGETAGLCWLGLVGLADPLRPDLPQMLQRFRSAGIRSLMITGDQLGTAQAIASRIGLDCNQPMVDAGQLPESAQLIEETVERVSGFARTSPAMKLEIVRALQQNGHVVAMTGDGINDGPALKTANVGVAMGVTGTDFAHAMSDLVLREDHPAAVLQAIEQGRTAFVNIKKSVRYLVATNLSELAATTLAVASGLPEPFDPLALLWTNIATDIWPAIALGLEPAEPGIMDQPPVSLRGGLLERNEWGAVATDASAMTLASLASFGYGLARYGVGPHARTLAFMTLTSSQLLYALAMRSDRPIRRGGLQPNPALNHAVAFSLTAQIGTVLLPFARRILRTTRIGPIDSIVVVTTAVLPLLARELLKERKP